MFLFPTEEKKNANILFDLFDSADLFITFFSSKSNREQTIYMYVNVSPSILSFKGAELSPVTSSLFNNFSRVVHASRLRQVFWKYHIDASYSRQNRQQASRLVRLVDAFAFFLSFVKQKEKKNEVLTTFCRYQFEENLHIRQAGYFWVKNKRNKVYLYI